MSPFDPRRATTPVYNPETGKTIEPGQFTVHTPGAPPAVVAERLVRETDDRRYERLQAERDAASKAEYEANIKAVRSMVVARAAAGGAYTDADIHGRVPMARFASPDDIAQAIAFLCDPQKSAFVNGHALSVDGGWATDGSWESLRIRNQQR